MIVTTLQNTDNAATPAQIIVTRADGSHVSAQIVQTDADSNLAIIGIMGRKLPYLKLQTDEMNHAATPGTHIRALATGGISHGMFDHWENFGKEIDFTSKIGPHDSGAPLLGDDGLVLGVAVGPMKDKPGHFNAIPIWRVIRMMPALTRSPWLPDTPTD